MPAHPICRSQIERAEAARSSTPIRGKLFVLAWTMPLLCGCATLTLDGENGEQHHVIIGFGVITTSKVKAENNPIIATRSHSLGFQFSSGYSDRMSLGYNFSAEAAISENSQNTCLEIRGGPFEDLVVKPCSAFAPENETLQYIGEN